MILTNKILAYQKYCEYYHNMLSISFVNLMVTIHHYFQKFMNYLGRYVLIKDRTDEAPYLERYYLLIKDRQTFFFNIFLHKFLKSDSEDLHDHPWSFISMPIYPGYWEYTNNCKEWRCPFSIRYSPANKFHRVELHENYNYCYSLFIPLKKKNNWGFATQNGWISHEKYLRDKKKNDLVSDDDLIMDVQENSINEIIETFHECKEMTQ